MSGTATPLTLPHEAAEPPPLISRSYWGTVGNRLRHDPVTLFFGAVVLLIAAAAIFAERRFPEGI